MDTIIFTKKEYTELLTIKNRLDSILAEKRAIMYSESNSFENAFGILRDDFGESDSSYYVNKLRKEWRK